MIDGEKLKNENPIIWSILSYLLLFLRVAAITPMVTLLFLETITLMLFISGGNIDSAGVLIFSILTWPLSIQGQSVVRITENDFMKIYFSWIFPLYIITLILKNIFKIKINWTLKEKLYLSIGWSFVGWVLIFISAFFVDFNNRGALPEFIGWNLLFSLMGFLYTAFSCLFGLMVSSFIDTIIAGSFKIENKTSKDKII